MKKAIKNAFNIIYIAIIFYCGYELRQPIFKAALWVKNILHLGYTWQVILIVFIACIVFAIHALSEAAKYWEIKQKEFDKHNSVF